MSRIAVCQPVSPGVHHLAWSLLVGAAVFCAGARAADTPPSTPAAVSAGATVPVSAYIVKKGDTLDKLMATYYKGSPLKPEVLRSAVLAANPALTGKKPVLKPGSQLMLPEHGQVMWATLAPYVPEQALSALTPATTDTTARRDWVRYP